MTIDAFIIAWNEADMIRHTLNHYSAFCRTITLFDNESTDATAEIARNFPNVIVIPFHTAQQIDEREYLRIKNNCWKNSDSDFVAVVDADEFIYHPQLTEVLKAMKTNGVHFPKVKGFQMYAEEFTRDYTQPLTAQVCMGTASESFSKQAIFSPSHLAEIGYSSGCHKCYPQSKSGQPLIRSNELVFLLHYKYLGIKRLIKKHEKYNARLSNYNKISGFGREYNAPKETEKNFSLLKQLAIKVI